MWRASSPVRWPAVVAVAVASCWRGAPEGASRAAHQAARDGRKDLGAASLAEPAKLVPDVTLSSAGLVDVLPDGTRRLIVSGLRVADHPDGSIERAREILPTGVARVATLPDRVGGGLVFYIASGGATQLWRAKSWLADLAPLALLWEDRLGQQSAAEELVPGFDRLYVRLTSGDIRAIDPESGGQVSLGPLPPATRIRSLAFADAWRAVVVADYRGALATFDAGNTWRPVPLDGANVSLLTVRADDFVLDTSRGRYLLSPSGDLARPEPAGDVPVQAQVEERSTHERPSAPLGSDGARPRRPLRAAIEDGWPLVGPAGEPTAVYAEGGSLHRVGLDAGRLLETRRGAFREDDTPCHAVPIGAHFGFLCAGADGGTAVYAADPSLEMREVARFARPRVVVTSGNGAWIVRGGCARDASPIEGTFCFFSPSGEERQWTAPVADEGAEMRPVALRDGRALFVSPPRAGDDGKLFVSRALGFDVVPLRDPKAVLLHAQMLEGVEERSAGVLGAWALVSEELRGVRIGLDGNVEVGPASHRVDRTSVAGRFGFDWAATGRGFETVDGGLSWTPVDLAASDSPPPTRAVAACGPVGCVHNRWLRVGWGRKSDAPDLPVARAPERSRVSLAPARGISIRCQPTGEVSGFVPPLPAKPSRERAHTKKASSPSPASGAVLAPPFPRTVFSPPLVAPVARPSSDLRTLPPSWSPFRGAVPPPLASGIVGLEAGTEAPLATQARIYVWGARGAEWLHGGHVLARFDDRFDLSGVRSTAVTAPPWLDEDRTSDALGLTAGQPVNWSALLDPSGRAAVLIAQRGAGRAELYAAVANEPLVAWRDAEGGLLPIPNSVVRIGTTWFFLHSSYVQNTWTTFVYRVDGGVVRRIARLPRVPTPAGELGPKLVRRSLSDGLGVLVQGGPGFDQVIRDWYVLPLDPDTGELDEPVRLVGSDLEGQVPARCPEERDGWLVSTELSLAPAARVTSVPSPSLASIELRLRLDPGRVCVDAIAARTESLPAVAARAAGTRGASDVELPMVATETVSGRRWALRCTP